MEEKIKLEDLEEQLKNCEPEFEKFNDYYKVLKAKQKKFQKLLEYALEIKKDEKKFDKLYQEVTALNSTDLVDALCRKGHAFKKELGDAFENVGYRLLELTRAGKREEVYYGILRIFVSQKKKFPEDLVEAFKPIYSDEMFKVFIFSFLSGIIGKEKQIEA